MAALTFDNLIPSPQGGASVAPSDGDTMVPSGDGRMIPRIVITPQTAQVKPSQGAPLTFDDLIPKTAPQPTTSAPAPMPTGMGYSDQLVSGMPIIGPLFDKATAATEAAVAPVLGIDADKTFGQRYADYLGQQQTQDAQFAASHPLGSTAANVVGGALATVPFGATGIGKAALGLTGNLATRIGLGAVGGATISGADAALRGENPVTAAELGGGLMATLPIVGAAGRAVVRGVKTAIEPFTAAGREARANDIINRFAANGPTVAAPSFVPGSQPTFAQATANPGLAGLERTLRNTPEAGPLFAARDAANADARNAAYGGLSGDELSLEALRAARDATTSQMRNAAFANAGDAGPRGVIRVIDNILNSPAGQRDAVKSALGKIRGKLVLDNPMEDRIARANAEIRAGLKNASAKTGPVYKQAAQLIRQAKNGTIDEPALVSGLKKLADTQSVVGPVDNALAIIKEGPTKLQTDPTQLYGIRQAAGDLMKFHGSADKLAAGELSDVQGALDRAIEKAAPGFSAYMQEFANRSRPIDVQQLLQKARVTDVKGNVSPGRLDSTIKTIEAMRATPGANKAKSISDAELGALKALRDDLRMAQNTSLGRAPGSNTMQNIVGGNALESLLRSHAAAGGLGAVAGYGMDLINGHEMPGVGTLAGLAFGAGLKGPLARADADILERLTGKMLNPREGSAAIADAIARQGRKNLARQRMIPLSAIGSFGIERQIMPPAIAPASELRR